MMLVAFGIGYNFYSFVERIDTIQRVSFFSDNDRNKWGKHYMGDERICIPPDEIKSLDNSLVIIMLEKETAKIAVEKQCDELGLQHIRVDEYFKRITFCLEAITWPQKIQRNRIHKFIELLVHGTTQCNFHCDYCYVWRKEGFHAGNASSEHTPAEIRRALSVKRLGGQCHINMCALGETLFAQGIEDIIYELADEGHFVSVITNGTVSSKIRAITEFSVRIQERIFLKLSFHYLELKRTNTLERFWDNVRRIKNSCCSYSIEITPSDYLIEEINEIKREFNVNANGVMPHITFTRDAAKPGLDLYSDLSLDEYVSTWKQFDSPLFDLKTELYKKKISHNCYAGCWSYRVNLMNGNLQSCYQQEVNGTIFDDIDNNLPVRTVGKHCKLEYCFNNHAFLAWGDVPDIGCCNYLDIRDRKDTDGVHWVKESYRDVMRQKLYENNYDYIDNWPDYELLYKVGRKPAILIFNSPDYGNLGDHAIAYAEKQLLTKLFKDKSIIEISTEQYIKENVLIKNAVRDDDIILLTGGGYLGSLWSWLEDLSLNIIQTYKNNKIIVMPQTIYFESSRYGDSEKNMFKNVITSHSNIFIFIRDKKSFQLMQEMGVEASKYGFCPDLALALDLEKFIINDRGSEVVLMLRDDKEIAHNLKNDIIKMLVDNNIPHRIASTVMDKKINLLQREKELSTLWTKMADAKMVITDRLHAAIFSVLLRIPCIVLDNKNGKIFDFADLLGSSTNLLNKCESMIDFISAFKYYETVEKIDMFDREYFYKEIKNLLLREIN